jgi:hypothetical protein
MINQPATLIRMQGVNRRYTTSELDPTQTRLGKNVEYGVTQSDGEFKVAAHSVIASDAKLLRHLVEVEVTVYGRSHFNNNWTISAPRVLN